ncbi:MAG: VWA domain-containing protein [Chthoniobacter sp.]|uniref:VWA domain-containing protein n=1 Tax=Chthoniobacter sp. TaxID=2510640 RepID=UPI0032A2AA64
MNPAHVQTSLRFVGDWPWYVAFGLALLLGAAAWYLYHREMQGRHWWQRILLPSLRALVVAMIVVMLSGPVLHHRKIIGQLSRLLLFVDGSKSMGLTDTSMSTGRKILILQRLGLWRSDAVKMDLPQAAESLAEAQTLAGKGQESVAANADGWRTLTRDFEAKINAARDALARAGFEPDRLDAFVRELGVSARELASREVKQLDDRNRAAQDLRRLGEAAARWQKEVNARFDQNLQALSPGENSPLKTALSKFDGLARWQRLQSLLLEGEKEKLLGRLSEKFDVRLIEIDGAEPKKLWQPTGRDSTLPTGLPQPEGEITNLATALKSAASNDGKQERGAVVLFSDGQHNEGESPAEVAKILAARGLPIYTVGFGGDVRPRDLAVVKIDAPDAVFFEDRISGTITLKDDFPAGIPFTVMVQDGDKVLWQQQLISEGSNLRKVPFSFPLSETVQERLKNKSADTQLTSVPLELKVSVSNVEGDREPGNNSMALRVRALTQKRHILILDGRPRWETRYLRNMFDRDEQWQVNTVIAGTTAGEPGFPRGEKDGQFPNDPAILQPYDLILFGEVPRALFKDEELIWIRDFVANRGGALVFIDGPRMRLKEYVGTALAPLFPVEWKTAPAREPGMKLSLSERAATMAPFALSPEKTQNAEVWANLHAPHWLSGATALPGAETLVEASVGGKKLPAVVTRPFGAGKVMYQAFDDSWRWRYEVADQYHVRYWNQIANWMAELPFAVRDKLISLDAGALVYRPGDSADLRVRLRDGQGRPVTNAAVDAVLFRDGRRVATIRLIPEENAGGLLRGRTAALEPGSYEVAVESAAIAERDSKARTSFKVEPLETGELTQLSLNEELLRQMSALTGGEYLREENIDRLVELLAPMSQGRVVESDTVLWQSYWWFLPIVLLLTAEWIIRKRVGML